MFIFKSMDALKDYMNEAARTGSTGFPERRSRERCNGAGWRMERDDD